MKGLNKRIGCEGEERVLPPHTTFERFLLALKPINDCGCVRGEDDVFAPLRKRDRRQKPQVKEEEEKRREEDAHRKDLTC